MKKVNEIRIGLNVLVALCIVLCDAFLGSIFLDALGETILPKLLNDSVLTMFEAMLISGMSCFIPIFIAIFASDAATFITGNNITKSDNYATGYCIINNSAVPFVDSGNLYLPFSYDEIKHAALRIKDNWYASYSFEKRFFPTFSLTPIISRRLAKRLLKEMKPYQIVVLEIPLHGWADDAIFISIHDIRIMQQQISQRSVKNRPKSYQVVTGLHAGTEFDRDYLEKAAFDAILAHLSAKNPPLSQNCENIYVDLSALSV